MFGSCIKQWKDIIESESIIKSFESKITEKEKNLVHRSGFMIVKANSLFWLESNLLLYLLS